MSDIDEMLEELEELLNSAVEVADETAAKLKGTTDPNNFDLKLAGNEDLLQAAQLLHLRLRDAHSFLATRRAYPPFIDIKTSKIPNALANIRSLASNLPTKTYHGVTLDSLDQTRETIASLDQMLYNVSLFGGPHGRPGKGPRGFSKWGLWLRLPRGLADSES